VEISPEASICAVLSSEGTVSLWDVRGGTYIVPTLTHRAAAMQLLPANWQADSSATTVSTSTSTSTSTAAPMLVLATLDDPSPKIELYDLRYMGRPAIDGGQVSMSAVTVSSLHSDGLSWVAGTTDGELWCGSFPRGRMDEARGGGGGGGGGGGEGGGGGAADSHGLSPVKLTNGAHTDVISCVRVVCFERRGGGGGAPGGRGGGGGRERGGGEQGVEVGGQGAEKEDLFVFNDTTELLMMTASFDASAGLWH